jgi:hypothetical protein
MAAATAIPAACHLPFSRLAKAHRDRLWFQCIMPRQHSAGGSGRKPDDAALGIQSADDLAGSPDLGVGAGDFCGSQLG